MFKATIDFFDEYKKYYILANSRAEAKSKLERYLKGIDFVWYELETVECDLIINQFTILRNGVKVAVSCQ